MTNRPKNYSTTSNGSGDNYREIAELMTSMGFRMNHSSARNYVIRTMKKFATAIFKDWNLNLSRNELEKIVRSPAFQSGIADLLHVIEKNRQNKAITK